MRRLLLLIATVFPSRLRIALLRSMGFSIGRNCRISPLSLLVADDIRIGNDVQIAPFAAAYNLREFHVGPGTIISYFGLIYSSGGIGSFRAGERFAMGMLAMIDATAGVTMGNFCAIGPRSILYTHANALPVLHGFQNRFQPISLGDRVWLMLDAKVMPGVTIASDVTVMPSAFVARSIKKAGMFLNSFMAEKDIVYPVSQILRGPVDEGFIESWFSTIFVDFEAFAFNHYKRHLQVEQSAGHWVINDSGSRLLVVDERKMRAELQSEKPTLRLLYRDTDPLDAESSTTCWLNCKTLNYHSCAGLPFWGMIVHFFFVRHGMALAEASSSVS